MPLDAPSPETETVLVVRPGALGDTILSLPLVASIRSEHPDARITFLGNPSYQDLLPRRIDFQSFDSSQWLWLFGEQADVGTNGTFDHAYVILNRSDDVARNLRNTGTKSVLTASFTSPQGQHVVEHLHEALGFFVPPKLPALMDLAPARESDTIWIHPGSGGPKKCVPLEIITRLAEFLRRKTDLTVAVTVGEADDFLRDLPEWERLASGPRYIPRGTQAHSRVVPGIRRLQAICRKRFWHQPPCRGTWDTFFRFLRDDRPCSMVPLGPG